MATTRLQGEASFFQFVRRVLTSLLLLVVLLFGLYLLEICDKVAEPWRTHLHVFGEFLASAVFLGMLVDLFLHKIHTRDLFLGIRNEIQEAVEPLKARMSAVQAATDAVGQTVDRRTTAILGLMQDGLKQIGISNCRMASQVVKEVVRSQDEIVRHGERIEDAHDRLEALTRVLSNAVDRIDNCQKEIIDRLDVLERLREAGFVNVVPRLELTRLFNESKAGETLCVKDTFIPNYHEWIEAMKEAIRRGVNVQMCVVRPKSEAAKARAVQLQSELPDFIARLKDYIVAMERTQCELASEGAQGSFEIRQYKEPPNHPLYVVVDGEGVPRRAFVSFYADHCTSFDYPHLEVEFPMLSSLYNDLQEMWRRNAPESVAAGLAGSHA